MKKVKLGELADVIVSGVDKKTKDGETPVKLCNFVDVYHNWAITSEMCDSFMEASARDAEIDKFSLFKGQVAITKDSETRFDIGIPTYIADDFDGVLLGYHCALITPNQEVLNGKYLNALLHSDYAKEYFANNATGSGQRYTISEDTIKAFPVPLIPIEEQVKIGNYLSDIDRKISCNKKQNDLLEKLAKQLYDYWFVQFDFPDENGKPYKSSGGAMVYNEKLKREIPEGWEFARLIDIANITMGQSPDGSSYNEKGKGIIFYQGSTDFGIRFPKVRKFTTAPTRYAKEGDILMSVRAPVGATNIASNNCCIGRGLSAINSKIGSITYIYEIISYFKSKFEQMNAAGTTFGSITKDDLHELPCIKPKQEVVDAFEAVCSPIFDKQMRIGKEIDKLQSLTDTLLPLLITGQATLK